MKYFYQVIAIVLLLCTVTFGGVNSTATITGTDNGVNVTLPAPFNQVFAGTFKGKVDGKAVKFYCVDILHSLEYNKPYTDVASTGSKVTYLLNNYYPYNPLPYAGSLSEDREAAAIQIAIWHFTDLLDINGVTPNDIKNRALELIADANANAGDIQPFKTLVINIPQQDMLIGSPVELFVETYNEVGAPVKNAIVSLSVNEGTLSAHSLKTNATGVAGPVYLTAGPNNSSVITASATVTIPHGTEYHNVNSPDGKQKVVIATPVIACKTVKTSVTWYNNVQLAISKTSSAARINDGDEVEYEITVKNIGTIDATGIKVSDVLPDILSFVSADGDYNASTGIWNAGDIKAGESKTLKIKVIANYSASGAVSFDLGPAADYNLFVLNDIEQPSSDTEGKLAVAHDARLGGYSVGEKLPAGSGDVLIVGRKLTFTTGRVYNGNVVFGAFIDTTHWNLADGTIRQDTVIDFEAASLYLNNLSSWISALVPTGTDTVEYGQLYLHGNNSFINKFSISGEDIEKCNDFLIDVPEGSVAVVNVSGDSISWHGGFVVKGAAQGNVLLNFYEAKYLKISGIDLKAAVLAPRALLDFPAGLISGQVVVYDMRGSGQFNLVKFTGRVTLDSTITNFAEIVACDQPIKSSKVLSMKQIGRTMDPTGLEGEEEEAIPDNYQLFQNYPNPFNPSTEITFSLKQQGNYSLKVYNMLGQQVAELINGELRAGTHSVRFNASGLTSGVYFYELTGNNVRFVQKMMLAK